MINMFMVGDFVKVIDNEDNHPGFPPIGTVLKVIKIAPTHPTEPTDGRAYWLNDRRENEYYMYARRLELLEGVNAFTGRY